LDSGHFTPLYSYDRKLTYDLSNNTWENNHYIWCGGNVTTKI